ncbi:hypothetical protein A2U01_0049365, partial [Trifolium medium]|nr:hypothetical protein [Trifolium medium]
LGYGYGCVVDGGSVSVWPLVVSVMVWKLR